MAEELISVILPVYNIEKYLEKWHGHRCSVRLIPIWSL